jgi:hypothetical protein
MNTGSYHMHNVMLSIIVLPNFNNIDPEMFRLSQDNNIMTVYLITMKSLTMSTIAITVHVVKGRQYSAYTQYRMLTAEYSCRTSDLSIIMIVTV